MLTESQYQTFRAALWAEANADLVNYRTIGQTSGIVDWYAQVVTPEFTVWRTSVEKKEVVQAVSREGTSFVWAGNGFIGRSVGELECWNQLFNSTLTMNPSLVNVRQAFADVFSGTGNAALNRTHLTAVSKRGATRIEKLFATGTGTLASPATMAFEGELSEVDVTRALSDGAP